MARPCSICEHPRLYDINKALAAREIAGRKADLSYRSIAAEFEVSKDPLRRHWDAAGHNRRLDPPETVPSALIPQSQRPQSVTLADGVELRIVSFQTLVETALAIGFHNIVNHPEIMTPSATAKFIGLALKCGWDIGETDAYGKEILQFMLGRAAKHRADRASAGSATGEMPEEADAPEDGPGKETISAEGQELCPQKSRERNGSSPAKPSLTC